MSAPGFLKAIRNTDSHERVLSGRISSAFNTVAIVVGVGGEKREGEIGAFLVLCDNQSTRLVETAY